MAVLDIKKIKTPRELEKIAKRDLENKTLGEIASWVAASDSTSRISTKAGVGYVIEEGYFGLKKNSKKGPDLEVLGIEIKTSPLKKRKDGTLTVKEPLSLNIINYSAEWRTRNLKESSVYKKNKNILFVWYVHDPLKKRSEYLIKYVFLWEMDARVVAELTPDYEKIVQKIKGGIAHQIHQYDHKFLTLCPKHGGVFRNPLDKKSKTSQPFSKEPAEIRAFRFKNSYMNRVIHRYLLERYPEGVPEFTTPKEK